jgi:SAM-dependent methyltransferase
MRGNDAEGRVGDGPDEEFLRYWARELLDPADPQRERWAALERAQIARNEGIAAEVERFVALRGRRVLDVGCQTGALAIAMARRGADVTGVDVEERLVEGARIRARGHGVAPSFRGAVAEAMPFGDASFDAVTFVDVIEHVADARAAISVSAVSSAWLDRSNCTAIPARVLADLRLGWSPRVLQGWGATLEVTNLLGQRTASRPLCNPIGDVTAVTAPIQDFLGYPLPGRAVFGGVVYEVR